MKIKQIKEYEISYERDKWQCVVCFNPAKMQAHCIDNTKINRKKYGNKVISNHNNLRSVCSLNCNTKVRISKENEKRKLHCLILRYINNILPVDIINEIIKG